MKRLPRLTVYRAADGWRWNYRAANGRIMADSAEAYTERNKCLWAACQVFDLHPDLAREGVYPLDVRLDGRP